MKVTTSFYILQLFRIVLAILFAGLVVNLAALSTPGEVLALASIIGVVVAGVTLTKAIRDLKVYAFHCLVFLVLWLIQYLANLAVVTLSQKASADFLVYTIGSHLFLFLVFYSVWFISTRLFWQYRGAATFECTIFAVFAIWLLSAHRNYYLDAPKSISNLSWDLGWEPQYLLIAIGLLTAALISIHLILADSRQLFFAKNALVHSGKQKKSSLAFVIFAVLTMFLAYSYYVNHIYSSDLSRAMNGVGQGAKPGESPLGFHSATGKTRQPAALVRLESDYSDNPWSPMLYLREGALSEFNGREIVVADKKFDTDVPMMRPGEPLSKIGIDKGPNRKEITQSIYLLAQHSAPFAIDFPVVMRAIKNPNPDRFKLAYQALSYSLTSKLDEFTSYSLGDPSWDNETLEHYLRAPGSTAHPEETQNQVMDSYDNPLLDTKGEDLRYKSYAERITSGISDPIEKAKTIVEHLSVRSIYTRNPGHQATEGGDPVAPYLFADEKRGYCVHFSHAAVYLLRLVGIPSRIATGYLTDLSYAKDGHILLHLGDRHAWPEIYVDGMGWIAMDVTPARAENEQVIIPDEKLLEELMSKIDPAEELVTPPPISDTSNQGNARWDMIISHKSFAYMLLICVAGFLLLKLFVREGYRACRKYPWIIRLGYISAASKLADIGHARKEGETHREYALRVEASLRTNLQDIVSLHEKLSYANNQKSDIDEIVRALEKFKNTLKKSQKPLKRILAFFSPQSLSRWGRW